LIRETLYAARRLDAAEQGTQDFLAQAGAQVLSCGHAVFPARRASTHYRKI
jgi:hypothetical protein